jgi:hypothetical protein
MARGLDASTATAISETATAPYYLIAIGFATPSYISSVQTISWDSKPWLAASVKVTLSDNPSITIFNEATSLGQIFLSDTNYQKSIDIYIGDQDDSAHPNPEHIFSGTIGEVSISADVDIRCLRYPPLKTPRHFAVPPHCNHLPRMGQRIETQDGPVILGGG